MILIHHLIGKFDYDYDLKKVMLASFVMMLEVWVDSMITDDSIKFDSISMIGCLEMFADSME